VTWARRRRAEHGREWSSEARGKCPYATASSGLAGGPPSSSIRVLWASSPRRPASRSTRRISPQRWCRWPGAGRLPRHRRIRTCCLSMPRVRCPCSWTLRWSSATRRSSSSAWKRGRPSRAVLPPGARGAGPLPAAGGRGRRSLVPPPVEAHQDANLGHRCVRGRGRRDAGASQSGTSLARWARRFRRRSRAWGSGATAGRGARRLPGRMQDVNAFAAQALAVSLGAWPSRHAQIQGAAPSRAGTRAARHADPRSARAGYSVQDLYRGPT